MEQPKYFTPALEELTLGYECEKILPDYSTHYDIFLKEGASREDYNKAWDWHYCSDKVQGEKYTLTNRDFIYFLQFIGDVRGGPGQPIQGFIRTPYLTKEAILAEGWKEDGNNFFDRDNDRHYFSWYPEMHRVEFGDNQNEVGFAGTIKDINTFRYICKLLNI